jgi:hypothetical protein
MIEGGAAVANAPTAASHNMAAIRSEAWCSRLSFCQLFERTLTVLSHKTRDKRGRGDRTRLGACTLHPPSPLASADSFDDAFGEHQLRIQRV